MKKRLFTIIVFLLLVTTSLYSQIENEIRAYVDTTEQIINNGKKLLVETIKIKNYSKANQIYNFIRTKGKQFELIPFSYNEELLIACFLSDWNGFFDKVINFEKLSTIVCSPNIYSIDNLLKQHLSLEYKTLQNRLISAELIDEKKSVVDIFLYFNSIGERNLIYDQKVNEFKRANSKSKFDKFISTYLAAPFVKRSLSYTFGTTKIFPTGNLNRNFSPDLSFAFSFDFNINKLYISLIFDACNLNLRNSYSDPIDNMLIFNEKDWFTYTDLGLTGGYFLLRNKNVHIVPYFNFGVIGLESYKYDACNSYNAYSSIQCGAGFFTEYKFAGYKIKDTNANLPGYFSLKFDAGYNILTKKNVDFFAGNISYMRLALVCGLGDF